MNNKEIRGNIVPVSKEHIEKLEKENGGKLVRATPINNPEHVEIAAQQFDDRIEYRAYNKHTERGEIAPFYFKEGESPAMEHIKQLQIIKNLIRKVE